VLLRRTVSGPAAPGLHVRGPVFRLGLLLWLTGALLTLLARGAVWVILHPVLTAAWVALYGVLWCGMVYGWWWVGGPLLGLLGGSAAWFLVSPRTFWRWCGLPVRSLWRRVWTYRRDWQPAMVTAGLDLGRRLPKLRRVRSTRQVDVVRARMLPGQTVEQWGSAGPRLRQTFGLLDVRPRAVPGRPHLVELLCLVSDPLRAPVPLPDPQPAPDLSAVPVGRTEDGRDLTLPLLGAHLLVGGETGAGKGSVLWSLILGVAPAVSAGLVRLWVIDPKGGMELAAGAPLFDRFAHGGLEEYADLLEEAVRGLRARAARLRGVTRKLEPSAEEPLIVIVVDELASLTAYVSDPELRRRIANAVSLILSQGRAVGVSLVAATQDARKEVVGMRDLFPARVALRTAEPSQADLLLGRGARERGARTEAIPDSSPGVAFVTLEDSPEPVRVRFGYADDDRIVELAEAWPRPSSGGHAKHATSLS
jgi:S-DNA-T family DNA segregation ATPase FtsK/SpoIIIE